MRSRGLLAPALLIALAGCPLPQPLAELDAAGVATPPRIITEQTSPASARILVSISCPGGAAFALSALVSSPETTFPVEARWFVDYDPLTNAGVYGLEQLAIGGTAITATARFTFSPPPFVEADPIHVVEVVVSNGFLALSDPAASLPNRSARAGFETQVFRWVFQYVAQGGTCEVPAAAGT